MVDNKKSIFSLKQRKMDMPVEIIYSRNFNVELKTGIFAEIFSDAYLPETLKISIRSQSKNSKSVAINYSA